MWENPCRAAFCFSIPVIPLTVSCLAPSSFSHAISLFISSFSHPNRSIFCFSSATSCSFSCNWISCFSWSSSSLLTKFLLPDCYDIIGSRLYCLSGISICSFWFVSSLDTVISSSWVSLCHFQNFGIELFSFWLSSRAVFSSSFKFGFPDPTISSTFLASPLLFCLIFPSFSLDF